MRQVETKSIQTSEGPRAVTVQQLPAMRAYKLLARLGQTLGPALALFAKGDEGIEAGVRVLFERLTPDALESITRELLAGATIEITSDTGAVAQVDLLKVFDTELRGEIGAILAITVHALSVNFGSFFGEAVALGEKATAQASKFKASITSAGRPNG